MSPALLAAFVGATALLMLIPGPNVALIAANTLACGLRAGLVTGRWNERGDGRGQARCVHWRDQQHSWFDGRGSEEGIATLLILLVIAPIQ